MARGQADENAADEARTGGGGDGVEVGESDASLAAWLRRSTPSSASTWARAAISGTTPPKAAWADDLRQDDIGEDAAGAAVAPVDDGGGGLVATRFDAENDHSTPASALVGGGLARPRRTNRLPPTPSGPSTWTKRLAIDRNPHRDPGKPAGAGAGERDPPPTGGNAAARRRADPDHADPDQRRPDHRPAADRGRRQGSVHQGDRRGPARRFDRPCGAFGQGHADGDARRAGHRRVPAAGGCARRVPFAAGGAASTTLPPGAVIGTSSLRRKAMALRSRPDLKVVDLRGNVETRLRKLDEGDAAATMLAAAGSQPPRPSRPGRRA